MLGLIKGTKVLIEGYIEKNIEDITLGDKVISFNETTSEFTLCEVVETLYRTCDETTEFVFSDGTKVYGCSDSLFLTTNGYKELAIGDEVIGVEANKVCSAINTVANQNVYDLDIEPIDNFVVNGVVVHNKVNSCECTDMMTEDQVNALIDVKVAELEPDIDNLAVKTTAPTSNNTGSTRIVMLDSEPTTKYSGYIYLVKEA